MKSDKTPEKSKGGRPSIYSDTVVNTICTRLALGESLRSICKDDDMPHRATVFHWLFKKPEFFDQYTRAREIQAETLLDDITDIADNGSNDWMARNDGENPGYAVNGEAINRSRLRVDARKWQVERMLHGRYGKKDTATVTVVDEKHDISTIASAMLVAMREAMEKAKVIEHDDVPER